MSLHRSTRLAVAALGLAGLGLTAARPADAQTIYNFVTGVPAGTAASDPVYTGVGVLGNKGATTSFFNTIDYSGSGNQNNKLNGVAGSLAENSNGAASTVAITYGAEGQFNPNPGGTAVPGSAQALLQNFAHAAAGNIDNITLTGLPANAAYTVVFYATNGQFGSTWTNQFSILSGALGATGTTVVKTGTTTGDPGTNDTAFASGVNYLTLTGTTSANGSVFASYNGAPTSAGAFYEGDFNALQIAVVPEPSEAVALGLAALGLAALALKARRRGIAA